jgi:hypothetical protein
VSPLLRRIIEIERLIEQAAAVETFERPAHEMTDSEAVEEWRRLCQRPPGAPEPRALRSGDELEEIIAAWRELTR